MREILEHISSTPSPSFILNFLCWPCSTSSFDYFMDSIRLCISTKLSHISLANSRRLIVLNYSRNKALKRMSQVWSLCCNIFNSLGVCYFMIRRLSISKEFTLHANTYNCPDGGVMSKDIHFHFMLPIIKVRTSMMIISLTRFHTYHWCLNQINGYKARIPLLGLKVGLEGMIRLLDWIKLLIFLILAVGKF